MLQPWKHDFFNVHETLKPSVFFANAVFMHAISGIPPLGSNSPLWSLTYEFAYYLIFPVAILTIWTSSARMRIACAVATVALSYYFGRGILQYFPIWLMGVGVRFVPAIPTSSTTWSRLRNVAVLVIVMSATAFRHTAEFQSIAGAHFQLAGDYVVGFIFAVGLYILLLDSRCVGGARYPRCAAAMANISYTLYVAHMPFLIFVRAFLNSGRPWSPGFGTWIAAGLLFAATVSYASVVWFLFESRTSAVRELAAQRFVAFRSLVSSGA
jgi:peptidoglycan/LPS O-acetylase OafA/YrhL